MRESLPSVTQVTLSFSGDFACCRLLCESADRFAPGVPHLLAVPSVDMPLFRPLLGPGRSLVAQEDLLPRWLLKLPMPRPELRRALRLPRRNVYLSLKGRPVRGWIAQQIMKLTLAAQVGTDIVLHLDSDTAYVRPLSARHLVRDGRVRLLCRPGAEQGPMHRPWHEAASHLLGLPHAAYHGADYIGPFVVWRQPVVARLLAHLAQATGRDPATALARMQDLSEYILYGVFCDKVLGLDAAGHFAEPEGLCQTLWTLDESIGQGSAPLHLGPEQIGICVQSTIPLPIAERRRLLADTIAQADAQAGEERAVA